MRTIINSGVEAIPFNAAALAGLDTAYFEAADPVTLQRLVQAEFDARAAANLVGPQIWVTSFEDLAGAGDGHTFTQRLFFVDRNANPESVGQDPALARGFYYMAAEAGALQIARTALNPAIAALDDIVGVTAIDLSQTNFVGASQGTTFMGLVLATMLGAVPTAATAVLDDPAAGDITVTGTNLLGTIPNSLNLVEVALAAGTRILLTRAEVIAVAPGSWTATEIIIDSTLIPGAAVADIVTVTVNGRTVSVAVT